MASWTNKRRKFVEEYFRCGMNATEAARRAGYKHPNKQGPDLVKLGIIQGEIERRLSTLAMDADEVLRLLGDHARGSISDFTVINDDGEWSIDLEQARSRGKLHLVKKLWVDKDGGVKLELYDAQSALVHLGRHHKLFTDQVDIGVRLQDVIDALPTDFREAVRHELANAISAAGN